MAYTIKASDWSIDSLKSIEWTTHYHYALNKDASGYAGIYFQVQGSQGTGRIYLVDYDRGDWFAEYTITTVSNEVQIPFTAFKPCTPKVEPHLDLGDLKAIRFEKIDTSTTPVKVTDFAFYGSQGVYGPTVCVDPVFDFYKPHPWSYWAKQIKNDGYTAIDLVIVWNHPDMAEQKKIVDAFHQEGIGCRLRLYPTTDGEAYDTHPEWRQILLGGGSKYDWRVYLCPNDHEFSKFMEEKIERFCREVPYDGIQLAEPWFEVWGGAYKNNPTRHAYACLCEDCRREFKKIAKLDPIELFQEDSPHYFEKPENQVAYEEWMKFRVDAINSFSNRCYQAARRGRPGIKIVHMYLADCTVKLDASREYQAMDLEEIIRSINPDMLTIEDSWQDWTQPGLKPNFILKYGEAYTERIKKIAPQLKIQSHLDIGSRKDTKRDYRFIREFSALSHRAGFVSPSYYEYSIQKF